MNTENGYQTQTISPPANLIVNTAAREVVVDGRAIDLTRIEFDLLLFLYQNQRVVVSNEEISRVVLNSDWFSGAHTIAVHVGNLRHKLGPRVSACIVNKRGIGYMFDLQPVANTRVTNDSGVELIYDGNLRLLEVHPDGEPFFGWQPKDVIGTNFIIASMFTGQSSVERLARKCQELADNGTDRFSADLKIKCADGESVDGFMNLCFTVDDQGNLQQITVHLNSI